ncbi:MAG: DUF4013 domain-containing protein [Proteobacteria bacterium]|nr:DUF4013 domain-containing protein [Pseudomonadota bacterium]
MELFPFIQFTLNTQYFMRWISGGIILYIPVLNFFSLGYLAKASRLLMIGSVGLPTWERKSEIWMEGVKLLFIFILYEAIPFFLFSFGFFLTTLTSITAFFGHILIKLSYLALFLCSFFIPFAFAAFSEVSDFKKALEFDKILNGIKEVFIPYAGGYIGALIVLYICKIVIRIPYLVGFILSSALTYYTLLIATYYFTRLYIKTTLSEDKITEKDIQGSE